SARLEIIEDKFAGGGTPDGVFPILLGGMQVENSVAYGLVSRIFQSVSQGCRCFGHGHGRDRERKHKQEKGSTGRHVGETSYCTLGIWVALAGVMHRVCADDV
ncbi:MAG TPA: hypothetical protein VLC12_14005, partial [Terriglobales bacterium]|nr:hypothetical protein [Terriglobales bacterium]